MSKVLITESELKKLILSTIKQVLDEKFTLQRPKPGEETIADRLRRQRMERDIASELTRCLEEIPDERAAIMAYKADPKMWNDVENEPKNFIVKMKSDENAKNYFNGMLLSRKELGPVEDSWMYNTLKALGDKCPGQKDE